MVFRCVGNRGFVQRLYYSSYVSTAKQWKVGFLYPLPELPLIHIPHEVMWLKLTSLCCQLTQVHGVLSAVLSFLLSQSWNPQ